MCQRRWSDPEEADRICLTLQCWGGQLFLFIVGRAHVVDGGVESFAVVEDFNVFKELGLGVGTVGEAMALEVQFAFEGAPEAFHGGVVVAAARSTHAEGEAMGEEGLLV